MTHEQSKADLSRAIRGEPVPAAATVDLALPPDVSPLPGSVPLQRRANLVRLNRARETLLAGKITPRQFGETVKQVLKRAKRAAEVFDVPRVKRVEAQLSGDEAEVFTHSRSLLKDLQNGLKTLLAYSAKPQPETLDIGMKQVERAMAAISDLQELAQAKSPRR